MPDYRERALQIAPKDVHVIITGETGTGKEFLADQIQAGSLRAKKPYVRIHTAALPDTLIEAELFGYEKGSFTGADKAHDGAFMQANTGTILLDEIGDMPWSLQTKLLRVTQDGSLRKLGGKVELKTDVRILALTHHDLVKAVAESKFRQDLYYRLSTFDIHVPPLRERRNEIPELVRARLDYNETRFGKKEVSDNALGLLTDYDWPGNIRELFAALDRASVISGMNPVISAPDLELQRVLTEDARALEPQDRIDRLAMMQKIQLLEALERNDFKQNRTAEALGISHRVLSYKIDKFKINHHTWRKKR